MGSYLGVKAVEAKGKIVYAMNGAQPNIPNGNRLIAVLSNGLWKIAPDVTDPSEFKSFYGYYSQGYYLSMELYLLPESQVAECPDEGRVPV